MAYIALEQLGIILNTLAGLLFRIPRSSAAGMSMKPI